MAVNLISDGATATLAPPRRGGPWARAWGLAEVRWAVVATVLFLLGLVAYLVSAPTWSYWTLFLACYATGGWEPGLAGLRALRDKTLDVDLLMVAAAIGAAAIGQVLDGGLLIVIFATSGALEAVATQRTADSVRGLLDLTPEVTTRLTRDGEEQVETASLAVGDVTLVRPGERIGADGQVIDGASDVDQATITGEGLPVAKSVGDEVFSGTVNGTGALRVRVDRSASDTVVARIVRMVEEASQTKAATQLFVEKIEQRYSIGMVTATLALIVVPLLFGSAFQPTLLRAMTFMIVASPCAVVLATMPPLLSAMANAGRHGVLVKSAVAMERLGQTTQVAFDKTGTLTQGSPRLADIRILSAAVSGPTGAVSESAGLKGAGSEGEALEGAGPEGEALEDEAVEGAGSEGEALDDKWLMRLVASAENPSEHPIARAIVAAAHDAGITLAHAEDFSSTPGRGVSARVDGHLIQIGSPAHMETDDPAVAATVAAQEAAGQTVVLVWIDSIPAAVLGIADRVRPGAADATSAISSLTGTVPMLLTGDNQRAASALAEQVGISDVRAGLLPHDKVQAVRDLQTQGQRVLLAGDGVNDAPALAAAHVGVAMGRAGSDLALDTADAVIVRDELATIPAVIALSRRARRLVLANLVIAAAFITVLVGWDLTGYLPLPLGVLGHEGSTVIVGLNGLRLLRRSAWQRALATGTSQ